MTKKNETRRVSVCVYMFSVTRVKRAASFRFFFCKPDISGMLSAGFTYRFFFFLNVYFGSYLRILMLLFSHTIILSAPLLFFPPSSSFD